MAGAVVYWSRSGGDEAAIRARFTQLAADINDASGSLPGDASGSLPGDASGALPGDASGALPGASTGPGGVFAALGRASRIGNAFTENILIDLGRGASPIQGRGLVIDMAARLQPRAAQYRLEFSDVTVTLTGPATAEVSLTATSRSKSDADDIVDAREFAASMTKIGNEWLIARAAAVSPLRRE